MRQNIPNIPDRHVTPQHEPQSDIAWITLPTVATGASGEQWLLYRPRKLTDDILAARRAFVAPLFAYMAAHSMSAIALARRARAHFDPHAPFLYRTRLTSIKNGDYPAPGWLIAGVCREIGQPIETVMGEEWMQRHMPTPSTQETRQEIRQESGELRAS